MSFLKTIITTNLGDGVAREAAERSIQGNPTLTTWAQDDNFDGKVKIGIWEAKEGTIRSAKDGICEFCHILEGVVEITQDGEEPVTYRAGDSFVMKQGFVGKWKTIETVRKIYVVIGE